MSTLFNTREHVHKNLLATQESSRKHMYIYIYTYIHIYPQYISVVVSGLG